MPQVLALVQRVEASKLWGRLGLHDVFSPRTLAYEKIRDYIANTEHDTIIGKMRFKGSENVSTPGVVSQWQNGEFEVVWPPQRATSSALFPKPNWK